MQASIHVSVRSIYVSFLVNLSWWGLRLIRGMARFQSPNSFSFLQYSLLRHIISRDTQKEIYAFVQDFLFPELLNMRRPKYELEDMAVVPIPVDLSDSTIKPQYLGTR